MKYLLEFTSFIFLLCTLSGNWLALAIGTIVWVISIILNLHNIYQQNLMGKLSKVSEYGINKGIKLFKERRFIKSLPYFLSIPMIICGCMMLFLMILYCLIQ